MNATARKRLQRERARSGLALITAWVPQERAAEITAVIEVMSGVKTRPDQTNAPRDNPDSDVIK